MYPVIFEVLIDFGVLSNMTPDYYQMFKDSNQDGEVMLYFILYSYVFIR